MQICAQMLADGDLAQVLCGATDSTGMVAPRLVPVARATPAVGQIVRCTDGGVLVEGTIVLSAWRRPYTMESASFIGEQIAAAARQPGPLVSFAVYRFPSMREPPGSDVRERLAAIGNAYPFHHAVNVFDSSGFANAMSRLFLAGVVALMRRRDMVAVTDSVEAGLLASRDAGVDLERWRGSLDALLLDTFGSSPHTG